MFDAHTRTVRYYDDGNLVGVLNKRGRGYGEYVDIGTYAYNVKRDELVIFERNTKKIKSYSCKDFSFQREIQMDKYINAMEYLSGDRYFFVNDIPYDEKSTTAEIYDENAAVVISSIPIPGTAADIIEDCVLCRSSNGSVSFVLPGYDNTVYQVTSDGITKIASFSFGASSVSKKFWDGKIDDPFYGYDFFQKNEKREVGVAPSFYHREKEKETFWYISGYGEDEYHFAKMSLFVKNGSVQTAISQLSFDGVSKNLQPVGASDGRYYFFVEPEYITDTVTYGNNTSLLIYATL